jgi:hypothetical protein
VRFDAGDYMTGPNLSALTAGEIFILLQKDFTDGRLAASSSWRFGTNTDTQLYVYNFGGSNWFESFGRSVRATIGYPGAVDQPRVVNMISRSGEWTANWDGTQHFTTATNTVAFASSPRMGQIPSSGDFGGEIRAVILYDGKLSSDDRTDVYDYLDAMRA